jgi:hypothetical protein
MRRNVQQSESSNKNRGAKNFRFCVDGDEKIVLEFKALLIAADKAKRSGLRE